MNSSDFQLRAQLRWTVYTLLIVVSTGVMLGRVMSVTARHGRTPFLSANDRSRIATVRALVENGTYSIDEIIIQGETRDADGDGTIESGDWHTIDMVRHTNREGVMRSYSSKPTLLPTLLAGQYWVIHKLTGETLGDRPFYFARVMLVLTNVLPMVLYFVVMAVIIDQWGRTDWGRIFAMAVATLGTFLPTFAVTINNHLPAAVSCSIALLAAIRIWYDGQRNWYWFALTGLFGAFTAANELPALSFFCMLTVAMLWKDALRTLLIYIPAAAVVVAGVFGTNYLAHDDWATPYAHRGDGETVATIVDLSIVDELDGGELPSEVEQAIIEAETDNPPTAGAEIIVEQPGERWQFSDRDEAVRFAIVKVGEGIEIRNWDDWYRFQGAYWRSGNETAIDLGEPSALAYAFQCTFGHHGIFSLTPVWLMSAAGLLYLLVSPRSDMRAFALFVLVATVVVLGFYLSKDQVDRTYGGWTTGLRWMFWFAPMWLLMLLPAADEAAKSRWLQAVALALLLIGTFSAFYGSANPWTHPWLYDYWVYLEWINP